MPAEAPATPDAPEPEQRPSASAARGWLTAGAAVGYDSAPLLSADPTQRSAAAGDPEDGGDGPPAWARGMMPDRPGKGTPGEAPDESPEGAVGPAGPGPSPVLHGELSAGAQLGEAWHLGGDVAALVRQYFADGSRVDARLGLFGGWAGERTLLRLHVDGGRYVDGLGRDGAWFGGTRLGAGVALGRAFWLGADLGVAMRSYDRGVILQEGAAPVTQRDLRFGGGTDLTWGQGPWLASVGLRLDRIDSSVTGLDRLEVYPALSAAWQPQPWSVQLYYAPVVRRFADQALDGLEHRVGGELGRSLTGWLALFARADFATASGEPLALSYQRVEAVAGLRVSFPSTRPGAAPRDLDGELAQGPATVRPDGVRFAFRLPGAQEVAVIGTFNGWDARRGRLEPDGQGGFEAVVAVPPGRHRYHLLVDGEARTPPGAPAYVDDGFGGRDAVLTVEP